MTPREQELLAVGRRMIATEAETLARLGESLDQSFVEAVDTILACRGKLIVSGMGKSGIIARKIAATLTSTGTPALFLHPAEAAHGDLGIITPEDVVVLLSYSGETDELRSIVLHAQRGGNPIISITGNPNSSLATKANVNLNIKVEREDCVLDIVPTSSTTAELAIGDAIATALMHSRRFRCDDFARLHPGGYIEHRIEMTQGDTYK